MKKAFLPFVLLTIVLVLALSACGPKPTAETPVVVEPQPTTAAATETPEPAATQTPAAIAEPVEYGFIPPEVPGEVIYIPFPVRINVDGDLSDWAGLPAIYVDRGPTPSADPQENGSFTFLVAADLENLYITMRMPDQNIVAGQHGTEFWNEDSMEFYVNASGDLSTSKYDLKMFQANINAADIGNTDPNALTITGVFSADAAISGYVFKTDDGWAFEAALSLADLVEVQHGAEIGFQAQINGASTQNRDIKLIWSNADTTDQSWEHPNLFGRALFFELGRTDVPQPSTVEIAAVVPTPTPVIIPPLVSVNQTGYFLNGEKIALAALEATEPQGWELRDAAGAVVLSGETVVKGEDATSGDNLHMIDFSAYATAGTGYSVAVGTLESLPFAISDDIYAQLQHDALAYFYHNRSGIEIDAAYAGEDWARPAGHVTDDEITCYKGLDADGNEWPGCDYSLDVSGGWYDAGDFGKYVVNGGISVWTLLDLYEQFATTFADGSQSIPENANGVPDILDEARWEMEFLLSMQVPEGEPLAGMVHHKMHDESWAGMPMLPPAEVNNDSTNEITGTGRYVYAPSTAATLNLAATAAQCARIWVEIDPEFSARCLAAAETAWSAALANPGIYAGNNPGNGGGNYPDQNVADEFYWASAELYITTTGEEYLAYLLESEHLGSADSFDWGSTAPLGTISLLSVENSLPAEQRALLEQNVLAFADEMLAIQALDGYAVPLKGDYPWGSNGLILNNMMLMAVAYQVSDEAQYLDAVRMGMDYIMGRNALNQSFVSGYGTYAMLHPHHRFWANDPSNGYPPPPPGVVSGGPNANPDDPAANNAGLMSLPPARRYLDDIGSYTTNEVTINWNAPLVWVAAFLNGIGK